MRRCPILHGFVLTCLISAGGCTEILTGGKTYYLDEGGGGVAGGDPGAVACESGFTTCGDDCVRLDSDPQHCGACAHDCLGAACSAGMCAPQVVASHVGEPRAMALDETHVYWTCGDGVVQRAPKAGGAIETLASGQQEPGAIAVDKTFVFWLDEGSGQVLRLKKDGNGPQKVLFDGAASDSLRRVLLDDENVYFTRDLELGDIRRAKKESDEQPAILVDGQANPTEIRLLGAGLMWSGFVESAGRGNVGGYVRFMLRQGGSDFTTIAQGEGEITALAAAGETAVWVDGTAGRIRARKITDSAPVTLAEGQQVRGLTADDTRVFWSTAAGNLKSHELASHQTRLLAFEIDAAGPVVADTTHVYILRTGADGGVLRVAR